MSDTKLDSVPMSEKSSVFGVFGLWHLGCAIAAAWTKLGHRVVGFDYDADRVATLNQGQPPLFEPGLKEAFSAALGSKTLFFTNDLAQLKECTTVFLAYDTPVREDDSCDTTIVERAVADCARVLSNSTLLIVSSQTPVGLCKRLRNTLREQNPTLELAYSPENLRLGEAIENYLKPGRIIVGAANQATGDRCRKTFGAIQGELFAMNLESAELVKHGINAFLATSVVFGNTLSDICEQVGGNMDDVVRGLRSDPRIGQRAYIAPGTAFSGGTLGRDLVALDSYYRANIGNAGNLFGGVYTYNQQRTARLLDRIEELCGGCRLKRIGTLGLTYKPGTSTLRRSLPLEMANELVKRGAVVTAFDPKADYSELEEKPQFKVASSALETADGASLVVALTEWPEFRTIDFADMAARMETPRIYDPKRFLDQAAVEKAGLQYFTVGQG